MTRLPWKVTERAPEGTVQPVAQPLHVICQSKKPEEYVAMKQDEHGTYMN